MDDLHWTIACSGRDVRGNALWVRWKMARYEYQKRYVKDHYTNFTIVMNKEKDKDLIAHLQAKENKSEYIKELIRRDMDEKS